MEKPFDLPAAQIVPAVGIDLSVEAGPHPYERRNAVAIDAHWQVEKTRNDALWDGRAMLFSRLALAGDRLRGACHEGRFATFLHWRRQAEKEDLRHAFANPVLVTSDGALVAVEMGAHTANAGLVYFPSGSFDPGDVRGGRLDVDGNMRREIAEETGIAIAGMPREPGYRLLDLTRGLAIVTRILVPWNAEETRRAIESFVAGEAEPEIARPVIVASADLSGLTVSQHVPRIAAWHFSTPVDRGSLVPFAA